MRRGLRLLASVGLSLCLIHPAPAQFDAVDDPASRAQQMLARTWDGFFEELRATPPEIHENQIPIPRIRTRAPHNVELERTAPEQVVSLRLLGHANAPLKVMMVLGAETQDEVQGVIDALRVINEGKPSKARIRLHLVLQEPDDIKELTLSKQDLERFIEINHHHLSDDIWMQDWGEVGAVRVAGADRARTVLIDLNREDGVARDEGVGLAELPGVLARLWNGHYLKGPAAPDSGNFGGNVEVTPDDVLILGSTSTEELRSFFAGLGYADRTVVLDSSWLEVGHVDEFLTFLPTPGTDLGYTIVKADPNLGLELLKAIPSEELPRHLKALADNGFRSAARFPHMLGLDAQRFRHYFFEVGALHSHLQGVPMRLGRRINSEWIMEANRLAAEVIDRNVQQLTEFLKARHGGSIEVDVVSLPALFKDNGGTAVPLLPGVVNLISLGQHALVPDPLLPGFQERVTRTLEDLGVTPHLVPNLSYHLGGGELHCGTNVFRHPNKYVHRRFAREAKARSLADAD